MACPDENTLAAFISGDLPDERRAEVHRHLETCSDCSSLVAALARGVQEDDVGLAGDTLPSPRPSGPGAEPRLERVGRYVVLGHLGTGGMGRVYSAFDPVLERKIALKLVKANRPSQAEEVKARLLREGKAIAQLNHPNIVSIFDMGVAEGEVYVAMELVDGGSLKQWLSAPTRTRQEVLDAFLEAGRGLAAAHRAGLVHRDFKPENVLVGGDRRVRVSDFGLSTSLTPNELPVAAALPVDDRLTQTGALVGTPAYMAPEQWSGRTADASSDQFSFCLALWEGLFGVRPFERTAGRPSWARVEPPAARRVPQRVRAALERGLSLEPAARFPSMEALLAALEPPRRTGLKVAVAVAGAALLLVGVGLASRSATRCTGAPELAREVWSPERSASLEGVLGAEPEAAALVRAGLDAWAKDWAAMHTDACEATRVRGEQSDQLLTLRMACLEHRRAEVRALLAVLARSTPAQVHTAPEAVEGLTPLRSCADQDALLAAVAPPNSPEQRARVDEVRASLAQVRALLDLGRLEDAKGLAQTVEDPARQSGYGPVLAEALTALGQVDERVGDLKAAEAHLLDAVATAEASRHDLVRAEAALTLMLVLGVRQAKYGEATTWDKLAEGALARGGGSPSLRARLLQTRGLMRYAEGKLDEAITLHREAVDAWATLAPDGVQRGLALNDLGAAFRGARRAPEALAAYDEALALLKAKLGEQSDSVAASRNGLANTLMLEGRFDEAYAAYLAAVGVFERRLGPRHFRTVTAYNNVGVVLAEQERFLEALPWFEKVVAAREAPAADPKAADAHANLGMLLVELGRLEAAQAEFDRARALLQGVAIDHFSNAEPLLGLARLALERKQGSQAEPLLSRVLELCAGKQGFRFELTRARTEFLQARVLAEVKGQSAEGRALAARARASFDGFGAKRFRRDLAVIDRWLARR